jgi:hypothetical protein
MWQDSLDYLLLHSEFMKVRNWTAMICAPAFTGARRCARMVLYPQVRNRRISLRNVSSRLRIADKYSSNPLALFILLIILGYSIDAPPRTGTHTGQRYKDPCEVTLMRESA